MLTTEQHVENFGYVLLPPFERPNTVVFDDSQLSAIAHQDIAQSFSAANEAGDQNVTLSYPDVADAAMFRVLGRLGSQAMASQLLSDRGEPIVLDDQGTQATLVEYVRAAVFNRHGEDAAALGILMFLRQDPASPVFEMARKHVAGKLAHYLQELETEG